MTAPPTALSPTRAAAWADTQHRRLVENVRQLVRIPSVSAQPAHAADVRRCSRWLAEHLRRIGLTRVHEVRSTGAPIVSAEWLGAPGRPTLLVYGHYDVQPADPMSAWTSPPFAPAIRGEDLFGRGASDDKGQMLALLMALEAYLQTAGLLPVNVRCLLEGEEEIGSPTLQGLIRAHPEMASADAVVISDTPILGPRRPAITCSLRGALSAELEVRGPGVDLHAGRFGGAIHNPLEALAALLASLHGPDGRVAIPGFYGRVRRWSHQERSRMASTGPTDREILRDARSPHGWGERGYSSYERIAIRPALSINGIAGGYQGPGSKGVIPASAVAKLGLRLVPDQDPAEIDSLLRRHIRDVTPSTVRSIVRTSGWSRPAVIDPTHPSIKAAAAAYRKGFGAEPVLLRSGGTIPLVAALQAALGVPVALMGFALPDDRMHAPNERIHLPNLFRGVTTAIWFLHYLGQVSEAG